MLASDGRSLAPKRPPALERISTAGTPSIADVSDLYPAREASADTHVATTAPTATATLKIVASALPGRRVHCRTSSRSHLP